MSKRSDRRARRGQSLLLVLLMLIVLAGILALTLDFGFVLQSRRLMQTGVNTSALEGLRHLGLDSDSDGIDDGRHNASVLIQNVFDDDMDPSQNLTTVGAGIDSSLVQGNGYRQTILGDGVSSKSLFENRSDRVYRPDPQLNAMNMPEGDMLAGDFLENSTTHREFSDYSRDDFLPDGAGGDRSAFLIRMRRTHDPNDLDRIDGVSSGGGGLPLMMGRLAWFSSLPANADYSIRRDGVTVRATAIASQKEVMRVRTSSNTQVFSAIPFGVSKSDFILNSSITIRSTQRLDPDQGQLVSDPVTRFGDQASFQSTPAYAGQVGYIAVIDESLLPPRAIGFFLVGAATGDRHHNASPRVQDAWDVLGELTDGERAALYSSRDDIDDSSANQLLKVGALVRTNH